MLTFPKAQVPAVQKQFNGRGIGNHQHIFHGARLIVPVAYYMVAVFIAFYLNPAVPHYFVSVISLFFYAHGVYLTTAAIVFGSSEMSVGVGK